MDVSQYLEIFIDETNEHLQTLSDCIMVLEKEPDNKDTINEVFRAAHSLKGMAGTMGFKRMQHLTHDMENVFQEVRSDKIKVNSAMIDLLFKCLDAIDGYLNNVKASSDEGTEENEHIIKELNDFIAAANGTVQTEEKTETPVEEKKESPPGDADYLKIELNDSEKDSVKAAEEAGQKVYGITVHIQKDCLLKAARAFLVFKAVEEFGNIIVYRPSSQDIEDEKFDLTFSFYLVTEEADFEKISHAASTVSEIESVVGGLVSYTYIAGVEKKEEPESVSVKKEDKTNITQTTPAAPAQAATPAAKKQAAAKPVTGRTVRVDIEKLDALMNQVSELIIAKNSLVSISSSEAGAFQNQTFNEQIEYLERITTNLHESVMKVRMVPIESTVNMFPRVIRDLS